MGAWVTYQCLLWMPKILTLSFFSTDSSYFSNVSSSNFLILRIQILVNSSGGIYKRCYFCLSQLPKIKKESTANTFHGQRSRGGHKEPVGLTVPVLMSAPFRFHALALHQTVHICQLRFTETSILDMQINVSTGRFTKYHM
jgi:hypothetical protein